jgi:DHA1 family bicyclomycin/chloramphenicol resistance-like MFS transporter
MPIARKPPNTTELIAFSALLISTVALSIDIMLPSLGDIAAEFGVTNSNQRQWVITSLFIGLAIGQLIFGPLSDRVGRRPVIFLGTGLFMVGSIVVIYAPSFELLMLGRAIQGLGAAGPRIAVVAMIRDQFEGQTMARLMSFIMGFFIFVPILAPSIGQLLLNFMPWRGLFVVVAISSFSGALWLFLRQPETLQKPAPFNLARWGRELRFVVTSRSPMVYTLCGACCYGALMGFINSSQQLLQDHFQVGNNFALLMGLSSSFIAAAAFINAQLVRHFSMERICFVAVACLVAGSCIFALTIHWFDYSPTLWVWVTFNCPSLFLLGLTFGNFNAIALKKLGHVAGLASAVYGTLMTVITMVLAALVGLNFDMTVNPVVAGYIVFGTIGLLLMQWDKRLNALVLEH